MPTPRLKRIPGGSFKVLTGYNAALDEVVRGLRSLGLEPTTRLKTSGTIIEKLRRQEHPNPAAQFVISPELEWFGR